MQVEQPRAERVLKREKDLGVLRIRPWKCSFTRNFPTTEKPFHHQPKTSWERVEKREPSSVETLLRSSSQRSTTLSSPLPSLMCSFKAFVCTLPLVLEWRRREFWISTRKKNINLDKLWFYLTNVSFRLITPLAENSHFIPAIPLW